MFFIKALVLLRERHEQDEKRFYLLTGGVSALLALVTILIDLFLPFGGYANLLRSVLLLPTAVAIFSFSYGVSLRLHYARMESDEDWAPYRTRFSPAWRRRIGVIVAAVLVVIAQATTETVGYTLSASLIGAAAIATVAFIRRSKAEANREELGIPDARDVMYDSQKRKAERDKAVKDAARKKAKQASKRS